VVNKVKERADFTPRPEGQIRAEIQGMFVLMSRGVNVDEIEKIVS